MVLAKQIAPLLLTLACCTPLAAQITANKAPVPQAPVALTYALHEPIVLSVDSVTEGETAYTWDVPPPAQTRSVDGGKSIYVWAPPGEYRAKVLVTEWEARRQKYHYLSFTVGKPEPTPPKPEPEPEPPPKPPAPVYPTPTADLQAACAELLVVAKKDPATAAKLAEAFNDFAAVLEVTPKIDTVAKFRTAMQAFGKSLQLSIPGLAAALEAAEDAYIGKVDSKLHPTKAVALLRAFAWALGGAA